MSVFDRNCALALSCCKQNECMYEHKWGHDAWAYEVCPTKTGIFCRADPMMWKCRVSATVQSECFGGMHWLWRSCTQWVNNICDAQFSWSTRAHCVQKMWPGDVDGVVGLINRLSECRVIEICRAGCGWTTFCSTASLQVYPGVVKSNHLERTTFFGKDIAEERRNFRCASTPWTWSATYIFFGGQYIFFGGHT